MISGTRQGRGEEAEEDREEEMLYSSLYCTPGKYTARTAASDAPWIPAVYKPLLCATLHTMVPGDEPCTYGTW